MNVSFSDPMEGGVKLSSLLFCEHDFCRSFQETVLMIVQQFLWQNVNDIPLMIAARVPVLSSTTSHITSVS